MPGRHWSGEELKILDENYESNPQELQELLPNRSLKGIKQQAIRRGLTEATPEWSEVEKQILKDNFRKTSREELLDLLPRRTWRGIKYKAQDLGLHRNASINIDRNRKLDLPEAKHAYIAGIIDGEGSISFPNASRREMPHPRVEISNNSLPLLQEISSWLGQTFRKRSDKASELSIDQYQDIWTLLSSIKKHLIIKKEQAELVLEYITIRDEGKYSGLPERGQEIVGKVNKLNKKLNEGLN